MHDQKNFILAMALSALVFLAYYQFYVLPINEQAALDAEKERAAAEQVIVPETPASRGDVRQAAITAGTDARITIDTPSLSGSFALQGTRFDELMLKKYDKTLDADDGKLVLLRPEGEDHAAYVFDNWVVDGGGTGVNAVWTQVGGSALTPSTPVVIEHQGQGFKVTRTVSVNDNYLITLDDVVTNTSGGEIAVRRKGASRQHGLPEDLTNFFILQEGPIAIVDGKLHKMKYKKLSKKGGESFQGQSGWAALTDKYWLAAAIAPQGKSMTASFAFEPDAEGDLYEASYALQKTTLSVGEVLESTGYIYAGAKRRNALISMENDLGIAQMERAIDWGALRLLTRPMSWALSYFGNLLGNFGLGILLITLIIKLILFPLNNKAYASTAKMKAVQPKVKRIQELYKDDRMKIQQEMMALYKKEGVNPVGGCLPMIPQIFIFFALYKSLFINVDMRHAPFFGWIRDLSAKDPLSILNGFGLLPWDAVPFALLSFFAIGPLALMYGASMAAIQTLSPVAGDPMQRKIFQLMPLIFMFILAPFAAGLLVYWVWNNVLTFVQQYYITRKYGAETPFDDFFAKLMGKKKDVEAE